MLFDCTTAFSGLSIKCAEHLSDEYSKTCLAVPLFTPKPLNFHKADAAMSDSIRVINIATSYCHLIEQAALILPLSTMEQGWRYSRTPRKFPLIKYKADNLYETSAILASYLDAISLQYRLKNTNGTLSEFCSNLNNCGRFLGAAALGKILNLDASMTASIQFWFWF